MSRTKIHLMDTLEEEYNIQELWREYWDWYDDRMLKEAYDECYPDWDEDDILY
jgi:hypothetical protein